jgi:hypothetical protein
MEKPNKEELMKKWAPILNNIGVTGSKADWMAEYAELHSNTKIEENTTSTDETFNFPNILPMAKKISAQTIGLDLVSVQPLASPGGTSEEEMERIKNEVKAENRDRIIESLIEDKEYKEMDITEHPDYKGPVGTLFHLDFKYGDDTDDEEVKRSVKTLGKKKK